MHLHDELSANPARIAVETKYGTVTGGRAENGTGVFLELPYALPPGRFEDPVPLDDGYRYPPGRLYSSESQYAAQPRVDGQAECLGIRFEDKVGLGDPTENPLFLNICVPPSFPAKRDFPVKVYIHGGFLQFGSPHVLSAQAQHVAAERSEVWVNIGYRLSAFGFLASARHGLTGNYGFKDQWLALKWIKANISAFGGNPDEIQVTGLSAGAHSVHQLLHHVSLLPLEESAPFSSAVLQSNAILTDPKTPSELEPQFDTLCRALGLDPNSPDALIALKDPARVPWSNITQLIDSGELGTASTFRGCMSPDWTITEPGLMQRQANGEFSRSLEAHGVKYVVVGETQEEWYLYSVAHPISSPHDIPPNVKRYFDATTTEKAVKHMHSLSPEKSKESEMKRKFGEVLSALQVYLPVRVLARDLTANGFPVLRYEIGWAAELPRSAASNYVTHGTDMVVWALRLPVLPGSEAKIAGDWLDQINEESRRMNAGTTPLHALDQVLCLQEDGSICWKNDRRWREMMRLWKAVFGSRESLKQYTLNSRASL